MGQDRPYLTALLCIDSAVVGKWAEKQKISYTTYTDLSAKSQVYDLLQKENRPGQRDAPGAARIASSYCSTRSWTPTTRS